MIVKWFELIYHGVGPYMLFLMLFSYFLYGSGGGGCQRSKNDSDKLLCAFANTCIRYHHAKCFIEVEREMIRELSHLMMSDGIAGPFYSGCRIIGRDRPTDMNLPFVRGTSVLVFTYQLAFQHQMNQLLPFLRHIDSMRFRGAKGNIIVLPSEICPDCSHTYMRQFFDVLVGNTAVGIYPNMTHFSNLFKARDVYNLLIKEFTRKNLVLTNGICFEDAVLRISSGFIEEDTRTKEGEGDWFFEREDTKIIRSAFGTTDVVGSRVCINQRPSSRSIVNIGEIVQLFRKLFHLPIFVFRYEGSTVLEQAQLISRCSFILHPHGGGMTNLIYMNRGATVLEIYPFGWSPIYYFQKLANSMNVRHEFILSSESNSLTEFNCSVILDAYRRDFCRKSAMIRVDTKELTLKLLEIFNSTSNPLLYPHS